MKKIQITNWVSTGLLTAFMLMSAGMYFFNHEEIVKAFETLGHPTYIIYPLAVAKLLGLVAIWVNKSSTIKEWAYAGFFFNFTLAFAAHLSVGDGEFPGALMALTILAVSYFSWKKLEAEA